MTRDATARPYIVQATIFAIPAIRLTKAVRLPWTWISLWRSASNWNARIFLSLLDAAIEQSPLGIVIADAPDVRIQQEQRRQMEMRGRWA